MKILIIVVIVLFIAQQFISARVTGQTETPDYKVLKTIDNVEIRSYPGLVLASTNMGTGGYSNSSGSGFRTIAGYIFGGNESSEKISMTSPVMVEMTDTVKMSFIMPSEYTLDNLPDPDDPDVYLHEAGAMTVAVIRYGGFSNDSRFKEHRQMLEAVLKKNNISTKSGYMFFGYNPPYELINRRNEVAVQVDWPAK